MKVSQALVTSYLLPNAWSSTAQAYDGPSRLGRRATGSRTTPTVRLLDEGTAPDRNDTSATGAIASGSCEVTREVHDDGTVTYGVALGVDAPFDNYLDLLTRSDSYLQSMFDQDNVTSTVLVENCLAPEEHQRLLAENTVMIAAAEALVKKVDNLPLEKTKSSWSDSLKKVYGVDSKDVSYSDPRCLVRCLLESHIHLSSSALCPHNSF